MQTPPPFGRYTLQLHACSAGARPESGQPHSYGLCDAQPLQTLPTPDSHPYRPILALGVRVNPKETSLLAALVGSYDD